MPIPPPNLPPRPIVRDNLSGLGRPLKGFGDLTATQKALLADASGSLTKAPSRPVAPRLDAFGIVAVSFAEPQTLPLPAHGPTVQARFDALSPRLKLSFLVITQRAEALGIDFFQLKLLGGIEGIREDRLFFDSSSAETLKAAVLKGGRFKIDKPRKRHAGMDEWGAREARPTNSMQVGIGPKGIFFDIDRNNPKHCLYRRAAHGIEVLIPGETDYLAVARWLDIDVWAPAMVASK